MKKQEIKINKNILIDPVYSDLITVFDSKNEYIKYIEHERLINWNDVYTKEFRNVKDTLPLVDKYLIIHDNKYYLVGNDKLLKKILKK